MAEQEAAFAKKVMAATFDKKEEPPEAKEEDKKNEEKQEETKATGVNKETAEDAPGKMEEDPKNPAGDAPEKMEEDPKKPETNEAFVKKEAAQDAPEKMEEDQKKPETNETFVKKEAAQDASEQKDNAVSSNSKELGPSEKEKAKETGHQAVEKNNEALAADLKKDWQDWKDKTFGKKDEETKQKVQWEEVKHTTWRKKSFVEVVANISSDKEEASSSKRKEPPTPPDYGDSSPEPSSAEAYDSTFDKKENDSTFDKKENDSTFDKKVKPPLPEWVAVDWYRTIEQQNGYLQKGALRALQRAGVKVWVLSFCGQERAREVEQKYQTLLEEELVDTISFTWSRVGKNGKKATLENWGVEYLFDDSYQIIRECTEAGMVCYWIGPPQDPQAEYDAYPDLMAAVERFLEQHEPNRSGWQ